MSSTFRATAIALILSVFAGVAHAQTPSKIAFINSQALMDAAPGRVAAESTLSKMRAGLAAQFQKLQDSAQKELSKYQQNEPKMSAAEKEKAQKNLQSLDDSLQSKQANFQQQLAAKQNELIAPITDLVRKVLEDIRVEDGYAMILDNAPGASVIVAADKNLDITDRVVSRLRATPASKLKATETAPQTPAKGAPPGPAGVTRKPPTK